MVGYTIKNISKKDITLLLSKTYVIKVNEVFIYTNKILTGQLKSLEKKGQLEIGQIQDLSQYFNPEKKVQVETQVDTPEETEEETVVKKQKREIKKK